MFQKTRNMGATVGLFLLSSIFISGKNHPASAPTLPAKPVAKTQSINHKHTQPLVASHKYIPKNAPQIRADSSIHTRPPKDINKYCDKPAIIVVNTTQNEILCGVNENKPVNPGSFAKLITLYLTLMQIKLGNLGLEEELPVKEVDARTDLAKLNVGPSDHFTTEIAIKGIVTRSAADACDILAKRIAGDVPSFVVQMNEAANSLGMANTVFTSPSGDPHSYGGTLKPAKSTITDITIALEAVNNLAKTMPQDVQDAVYAKYLDFHDIRIPNHALIPGATFGKTAWANQSGRSTILIFPKDGDDYIVGVTGGKSNKARSIVAQRLFQKFSSDKKEKTELVASTESKKYLFHKATEIGQTVLPEETAAVNLSAETTKSFHPHINTGKDISKAMAATVPKMK